LAAHTRLRGELEIPLNSVSVESDQVGTPPVIQC
jgi:hypothetical protein